MGVGRIAAVAAVAAMAACLGSATAATSRCEAEGLTCLHVTVPLDPTGTTPGTVSLWVNEYVVPHPRGVMFLLAGGPGQASAEDIYIGTDSTLHRLFPGYTLVTFDPRGTGMSDPLHCSSLSAPTSAEVLAARCAKQLGPDRDYYRTTDNADDIDAVRKALGFDRIGIWGTSYGTDVAVTYARMYPTHVERLLLDSVVPQPITNVSFIASVAQGMPAALRRLCAGECAGPTTHFAQDVVKLASSLAAKPLKAPVRFAGRVRQVTLDAPSFFALVVAADLSHPLQAELPAAVNAALAGDPLPLLRLEDIANPFGALGENVGPVLLATSCDDSGPPWQPDTPDSDRPAILAKTLAAMPPTSFGEFGPWVEHFGALDACTGWPPTTVAPVAVPDAYPDVPVLAVSGALDMRAPVSEARAVLSHFPHGHLLTVSHTGHSALFGESTCAVRAVQVWLDGRTPPANCAEPLLLPPFGAYPKPASATKASAVLATVSGTLRDAEAMSGLIGDGQTLPGLAGGTLEHTFHGELLRDYSDAPGIGLSGVFHTDEQENEPWDYAGVVQIRSDGETIGSLVIGTHGLRGNLDGRSVAGDVLSQPPPLRKPLPSWSEWTPPSGTDAAIANAIARRVGSTYLRDAGGDRLVRVTSAAATSSRNALHRPISAIAVRPNPRDNLWADHQFHDTAATWTYDLCGSARSCSIAGTPSLLRAQLVAREAFELALYTFEYEPGIDAVTVFGPPAPGTPATFRPVFYVQRTEVARDLSRPLARTLPRATPPLPTDRDATEAKTISRFQLADLYTYLEWSHPNGTSELILHPERF